MQKFFLLLLSIALWTVDSTAQSTFSWRALTADQAGPAARVNNEKVPVNNLFNVDFESLNAYLLSIKIDDIGSKIISLPVLDGKIERFEMINSGVLGPILQAQFPNIRTFMLRSTTDGSIAGRIGTSSEGFYGIIEFEGREILINKVNKDDKQLYAVFDLADNLIGEDKLHPMSCGADYHTTASEAAYSKDAALNLRSDEIKMKHFRVGIATTSAFVRDIGATTNEQVLAKIVSVINQVNLRYNKDLAMHLDLIDKTINLFNLTVQTDFFKNLNNGGGLLGQSQEFFQSKLLNNEYDFGQTWTEYCTDVGGVVSGSACENSSKARGVSCGPNNVGYFLTTVKHEMGHQFSASHTFNSCDGSSQQASAGAYEPGSGSTIMAYPGACGPDNVTNGADDYFHIISIMQVRAHNAAYPNCGTDGTEINRTPDITLPQYGAALLTIPMQTPYELIGQAVDADNDALLYGWEQFDQGNGEPLGSNFASGPLNRSYPPTAKGNHRLIPRLNNLVNDIFDVADRVPSATREMNWKLVVRDYNVNAGGVSMADFRFLVDSNAGPFQFTFPVKNTDTIFEVGQYVELKWDVANSDKATVNCKYVDIFYSTDGGLNFTDTLVLNTPNDGSEFVMIPTKAVNSRFKIKGAGSIFLDISRKAIRTNEAAEPGFSYDVYPHNALLCPTEPKTFTIKSITWKDFTTAVKVELVDGWPADAVVTLNKSELSPGENVTLSIDTKNVNEAGFFTIRLRAVAEGHDTLWRYVTIEVLPSSLQFVGAIQPTPGTVNAPQVPAFAWQPIPGSDIYQFELSDDSKFYNIVDEYSGTSTSFNTLLVLKPGTIYYWRVRAINRCFEGPWSVYNTFQTILYECNTISALGLPKNISSNVAADPVELKFDISNKVGITADINVKNINIAHDNISKLEISAKAPSGKNIKLISERCAGISGMLTSFDDSSPLDITCGQIKGNKTFKPGEPLSGFNGEQVQGDWSVLITTKKGGSTGKINSLDFELCASVSSAPIVKINNNLFKVKKGNAQVLENKDLKYESEQTTEDNIIYILLTEPEHGQFTLYGQVLHQGDRFLQAHLNAWALLYTPYDPAFEGLDEVELLVRNDKFGYLAPETLNIEVKESNTVSTTPAPKDISNLIKFYPNPTTSMVNVDLTDFKWVGTGKLTVSDITGKAIISRTVAGDTKSLEINLNNMPAGIYFANLISGNYTAKQKLIKI